MNGSKEKLSSEQPSLTAGRPALSAGRREKLFSALKVRFEKNVSRPKGLQWAKVQARRWKPSCPPESPTLKSCGRSMKWKVNRTVVGHDKKTAELNGAES